MKVHKPIRHSPFHHSVRFRSFFVQLADKLGQTTYYYHLSEVNTKTIQRYKARGIIRGVVQKLVFTKFQLVTYANRIIVTDCNITTKTKKWQETQLIK